MIAVPYRITLREPLLATALSGEPNSAIAHPFVPGSLLRGLAAGRFMAGHPGEDLACTARPLLFNGQTRFLNAYPANADGQRALPAPFSWRKEKNRSTPEGKIEDHALMDPQGSEFDTPKPLDGFAWLVNDQVTVYQPGRQITVHTLRDRFAGRPTAQHGAVYRYDALAAGEVFAGAVIVGTKKIGEELLAVLPSGDYRLGGAATAGYGLVTLEFEGPDGQHILPLWQEYQGSTKNLEVGQSFVVTLLSDAVLRGDDGEIHSDLARALGLPVTQISAFKKVLPLGGFNRKWGLPLPQTPALRAGSVFKFQADQPISSDVLARLVESGIGERRIDGMGRLAIDWQRNALLVQTEKPHSAGVTSHVVLTGAAEALAMHMATRRRRAELDADLVEAINRLRGTFRHAPPNSQISRIRVIARNALAGRDLSQIGDLFKRTTMRDDHTEVPNPYAMRENAIRKFEAARVDGQRLSSWIVGLVDHPETVWAHLGGDRRAKPFGGVEPEGWLAEEYAVRLVDGVLAQAMAARRTGGD